MTRTEVELKAKAPRDIEARLASAGAKRLSTKRQEDVLYDLPGEPLRKKGVVLRLRTENGRSLITYKGPSKSRRVKAKEEIEFAVAPAARTLLECLGYSPTFSLGKTRTEYSLPGVTVCVDSVDIVGNWVEFECFGQAESCRRKIVAAAAKLGIPENDLAPLSYTTMVRERLKKGSRQK